MNFMFVDVSVLKSQECEQNKEVLVLHLFFL